MGSAIGDYDGDGDLDWFVSSIYEAGGACGGLPICNWGDSGNRLYRNDGRAHVHRRDRTRRGCGRAAGDGVLFFLTTTTTATSICHTPMGSIFPTSREERSLRTIPRSSWENDGGLFTESRDASGHHRRRVRQGDAHVRLRQRWRSRPVHHEQPGPTDSVPE